MPDDPYFKYAPAKRKIWRFGVSRSGIDAVSIIILLNIAVFFFMQWLISIGTVGGAAYQHFNNIFGLSMPGLREGNWWQIFTHLFLHGGNSPPLMRCFHIAANMMMIYMAGKEIRLTMGNWHFLAIYFTGGIIGGLLQILWADFTAAPGALPAGLVGASGSAFAVILAFCKLHPRENITALLFFVIPLHLKARNLGLGLILSTIALLVFNYPPGVGHLAHLGGALLGWFYIHQIWSPQLPTIKSLRKQRDEHSN